MAMGSVIQTRRKGPGMTQEQLAQALNITAADVNKWENDVTNPDIAMLVPFGPAAAV